MFAYIKGMLHTMTDEAVIIDVHGVGYEVVCPNPFQFQHLSGKEILIHTYFHVREDAQILYGFQSTDEKYLFRKLLSVSGIGPKGALAILAGVDINGFIQAIEQEDDKFLTSFPGVGKKTARQIILDLKGKLVNELSIDITNTETDQDNHQQSYKEAEQALSALGYTDKEFKQILKQIQKDGVENTDQIIKQALRMLSKR